MRFRLRTLLILAAVVPPLLAYVGSYYVFSRRGYVLTDSVGGKGFWFVVPYTKRDARKNEEYQTLYWPLVRFEELVGTGRGPASGPCGPELPP